MATGHDPTITSRSQMTKHSCSRTEAVNTQSLSVVYNLEDQRPEHILQKWFLLKAERYEAPQSKECCMGAKETANSTSLAARPLSISY